MGPRRHRAGRKSARPRHQAVVSRRGAQHRERPGDRWGARGVQSLGRHVDPGRVDLLAGLLRQVRLRPPGLHPGPLRPVHGPAGRLAAPPRRDRGEPGKRRRCPAFGRGRVGLPGRRLRLLPVHLQREHHRLRRPHRLRQDRHRSGGTDRAHRVHRRPGDPAVPDPRQLAGAQVATHQGPDQHSASELRLPVRSERDLSTQSAAAGSSRSTSPPASAATPTSTRSTRTCAR
jgi:hypothetical protein